MNRGEQHSGRYILGYYRASRNNRSITNRDAWQNSYVRAKPDSFADVNRCWQQLPSFGWILLVVQSGDHSVVANQSPVANIDSALVLNGAANIDEHVLINMDIFPAISMTCSPDQGRGFLSRQPRPRGSL